MLTLTGQVLALTYMMDVEAHGSTAHLRTAPAQGSAPGTGPATGWVVPEPCRYGAACTRSGCWYGHPGDDSGSEDDDEHAGSQGASAVAGADDAAFYSAPAAEAVEPVAAETPAPVIDSEEKEATESLGAQVPTSWGTCPLFF